jgi:hypothetical protein
MVEKFDFPSQPTQAKGTRQARRQCAETGHPPDQIARLLEDNDLTEICHDGEKQLQQRHFRGDT